MTDVPQPDKLPAPLVIDPGAVGPEGLLDREWLLTNSLGAYASSSLAGTNTRRYHGLLVAATAPPVGRVVVLSCLLDQLCLADDAGGETAFDLATFEFPGAFNPDARGRLAAFRNDVAPAFVYRCGPVEVVREVILADAANAAAVRYRQVDGPEARLRLRPFLALRDVNGLRRADRTGQMTYLHYHNGIRVEERSPAGADASDAGAPRAAHLAVAGGRARFAPDPQWWYRFRYRADLDRGEDGFEDLYTPGVFEAALSVGAPVQLTVSLDDPKEVRFDAAAERRRRRLERIVDGLGEEPDETSRRLAVASDAFVVSRRMPNAHPSTTILAGYPWFADWGRDAMIALPGLLLETRRFEQALSVLRLFAGAIEDGLVPNFLDASGRPPAFNSIDASLWFVVVADRYVGACGDEAAWRDDLAAAVERILRAYLDGTRFGIRADADGLLAGGDAGTQLTWMDAQAGGPEAHGPVTPRHGKSVEVNALWHAALRIAADRGVGGRDYAELADGVAAAFEEAFWNERDGCLYDCVRGQEADASIRPHQVLAVSLPHCPLPHERQRAVVDVVRRELLTPAGLRSLTARDARYRPRYGGSRQSRDLAYHQGTVWPWLMGPFIEAWLKVSGFLPGAREQARQWLARFDAHLTEAGIGQISEVFDGDPPHAPAGCIAQAWSVGEVLRARRLVNRP